MPPLHREPMRSPEEDVHRRVVAGDLKPGSYEHMDALLYSQGLNRKDRRKRLKELGVKKRT